MQLIKVIKNWIKEFMLLINKESLQTWEVDKTVHDKQTGMDAVVFERDVDGKSKLWYLSEEQKGIKL